MEVNYGKILIVGSGNCRTIKSYLRSGYPEYIMLVAHKVFVYSTIIYIHALNILQCDSLPSGDITTL